MPILEHDIDAEVRRQLPVLTLGRLVGNGVSRLIVPFLGVIGRGLGVPISTMGTAASAGDFTGLLAPFIGRRLDRGHHVRAMAVGMALVAVGAGVAAVSPGAGVIAVGFVIISLGKLMYDPAVSTWASERVEYARRARVIGFLELSWAGALLVVVPLLGLIVAGPGWRWAYGLMACVCTAMALVVRHRVRDEPERRAERVRGTRFRFTPTAVTGLVGFGLLMTASNAAFVVFGAWLGDAFGFSPAVIGLAAVLLGVAELAATLATIRVTDRLGKRTAVTLGAGLMLPAALALGAVGHRAWLGLALFAVFVFGFEFAIVSGLPLVAELQTDARAAGLGLAIGLGTVGRGVMSIVSTRLYEAHGIGGSGALSAGCAGAVMVAYGVGLRRQTRLR